MRKIIVGLALFLLTLAENGNPAKADINWNYPSPLTVVETITDMGGYYKYEYSLVNVDTSPIWFFGLCTTFRVGNTPTEFSDLPGWHEPRWTAYNGVHLEYSGRNLDPQIAGQIMTFTESAADSAAAIQVGEAATGFSFTDTTYDPFPKYYFYETIASGYTQTNGTGNVAAVGLTVPVPEPSTLTLLIGSLLGALGIAAGRYRRR